MPIYNPDTGQYEETEEEKRRRREAGTTEVGKTTITNYQDGSQTRTVTQEIPAAGPVAPVDMASYNQRIAQMESGGRTDIGQHSARSTAYGPYGLTQAAYEDARRRNPNLPADIRQATPEQQQAAQTAFTQQQAGYLQNYGVPVNENTLSAAHFLGAKGLSDFMKTGYISPQAAAANGGEENVRRIVQQRLGGQAAPASAAQPAAQPQQPEPQPLSRAQQAANQFSLAQGQGMPGLRMGAQAAPAPQPMAAQGIDLYQQAQNNPMDLLKLRNDQNQPEFIRTRAADRAFELMDQERKKAAAEQQAQALAAGVAQGDPKASREFSRAMTSRTEEGSYLKMILLSFISPQLAGEEAVKLGFGNKDQVVTDANGNSYMVTFNAKGTPVRGFTADGADLDQKQLINIVGGQAGLGKGTSLSAEVYVDTNTGRRYRSGYDNTGKAALIDIQGGPAFRGDPRSLQLQAVGKAFETSAAGAAGKGAGEGFTPGQIPAFPGVAGGTAPVQQGTAPVQQAVPAQAAPVQQAAAPVTAPVGGIAQQREALKIQTGRSESLNKILDEEVRPQASAGDTVSSVRKQQFAMFNRPDVDMNKIFGLATGAGAAPGDQKWTIVRDIVTSRVAKNPDGTPMTADQLSQRLAALNLTPAEQSVLAEYNISNARINAATLKETAGPGAVTLPEQQMNRERNVDITKTPALAAYNAMAQSQFDGDRARYKGDWASTQTFSNALEMDREWRKENKRLGDMYMDIARKRIEFISANGNTVNAIKEGYRRFPVPEYDPNIGQWKKTKPLGEILGR